MGIERMPRQDKTPLLREVGHDAQPLFNLDDEFMQSLSPAAKNVIAAEGLDLQRWSKNEDDNRLDFSSLEEVMVEPPRIVQLSDEQLEIKYEALEDRAGNLADKRGISLIQALEQLDTDGVLIELQRRRAEARNEAGRRASVVQATTNSIAINKMREESIARERSGVAAQYPDGSLAQKRALLHFDARQVVRELRRGRHS